MANPIFLSLDQVMTIIMGEMPEGVFSTDLANSIDINRRSYSSSEIRAHAQLYADLYANLLDIYENKFISTVQPDEIGRWETDLFSTAVNANLPFSTRQQNLLTKWRARGGLSYPYIYGLVSSILTPLGLAFDIFVFCGGPVGAWILDVSALDTETFLAEADPLLGHIIGLYDLDCNAQIITVGTTVNTSFVVSAIPAGIVSNIEIGAGITGAGIPVGATVVSKSTTSVTISLAATANHTLEPIQIQNYIAAGLTQSQFESIQATAYTYAVYIYGTADAQTLATLDQVLTQNEPGGSTHIIINNAVPPIDPDILDLGGGSECALVDAYDCGYGLMGATFNVWDFAL